MKFQAPILLSLLFLLLAFTDVQGQNQKLSKEAKIADKYFDREEYYLAAEFYVRSIKEDPKDVYSQYKLAESYRLYFDYKNAEKAYASTVALAPEKYPLAQFWLGLMQKNNGKYQEAKNTLDDFIKNFKATSADDQLIKKQAQIEYEGCILAINEFKKPVQDYGFRNMKSPINTANSDYAAALIGNDTTIVITTSRPGVKGNDRDDRFGQMFSDNLRFEKKNGRWVQSSDNDKFSETNTVRNDGAGTFNRDRTKFYYTSCFEGEGECSIYVSEKKDGKWQPGVALNANINFIGVDNFQPALSPNDDTLYFVSKRPGGFGMSDIYLSVRQGGGEDWGEAKNMGSKINTPYIDMSPAYYPKRNVLLFSSNGREGFGGLDIYMLGSGRDAQVRNMGLPFNSQRDDFYMVLGEEFGYLSSNREGGIGNDDIYGFYTQSRESLIAVIYRDSVKQYESISLLGKIVNPDNGEPGVDVAIKLTDENGKVLKVMKTNQDGLIRYDNLATDQNYKLELVEEDLDITSARKFIVDDLEIKGSSSVAKRTLFENIYFDFDKSDLRKEAKKVLDELVAYAKRYPELQVEMRANTDAKGSDAYNVALSERRGNKALEYLIAKGVDKSQLVVNPQGEGVPIASNNNPIGRQLNRRVEFYIVGGPGYEAQAMVYVPEQQMSLAAIAQRFGMTESELREMNDLSGDNVAHMQPLRVRRSGDEKIIAPVTMMASEKMMDGEAVAGSSSGSVRQKTTINPYHPVPEPPPLQSENEEYYVVEPLNTISGIAMKYDMTNQELMRINNLKTTKLQIGQRLKVIRGSKATSDARYHVKEGDSLSGIAKKFGLTLDQLKKMNDLQSNKIYKGMVLKVK